MYTLYYDSPVGLLQISCSEKAITSLLFVDDDNRIPTGMHPLLDACVIQLDEYFNGKRRIFDLPLSQEGTEFQKKIWDLLYKIPFGKTISYNELSHRYGDPKAIRAAASANGRNNLAIIIPCHRVIGSNQSLTGYAGGLWRKKWLLEHEAKHYHGVQQLAF